jgi:hypothetical protein
MSIRHVMTSNEVSLGYKAATVLAFLAFLIMSGAILYGFLIGDFAGEGGYLLSIPWGQISLIDVYIGFLFICAWILFREPSFWRALPWLILMMIFGNATAGLYIFLALLKGNGSWRFFWLGSRAQTV